MNDLCHPDRLREQFSEALSAMYRAEVPLYAALLDIVKRVNAEHGLQGGATSSPSLDVERHGAIRVGTAAELATLRRLFALMGMVPVGYYDLSAAAVPVHATAFRPVDESSLHRHPFRMFTSLLRLELIEDPVMRQTAAGILSTRRIFTPRCLELLDVAEARGGLSEAQARELVAEAIETFRWHADATVDAPTYAALRQTHPLVADVVCFHGPHVNHLTPRVRDIDRAHESMRVAGMRVKATIEGPPARKCPILLRQTSFLALQEAVNFRGDGTSVTGSHMARFGEIEQRGQALTRAGRVLYDRLLKQALASAAAGRPTDEAMSEAFRAFPDRPDELRRLGLVHVRYRARMTHEISASALEVSSVDELISAGHLEVDAMVYEDFLPISAAGIFQSNLGEHRASVKLTPGSQDALSAALGVPVVDPFELYETAEKTSLQSALSALRQQAARSAAAIL